MDRPFPSSSSKWSEVLPPAHGFVPDVNPIQVDRVGKVNVGENFYRLPPDEQQETVKEIVASIWHSKFAVPLAKVLASRWG